MLITVLLLFSMSAFAQSPLTDVQASHIDANVPPPGSFDAFLKRDLLAYFHVAGVSAAEYKLLRDEPTQSGVAYPKYYLWVKVRSGNSMIHEGAVRVAAIERERFEVTSFLSRSKIQSAPSIVGEVFPSALVPLVLSLAGIK